MEVAILKSLTFNLKKKYEEGAKKMGLMSLPEYVKERGGVMAACFALEVPYNTLNRWLAGKSKPSRPMIRLMRLKGINLEWSIVIDKPMAPEIVDNPKNQS